MTCIVGIADKGRVHLGGDTQGSTGWSGIDRADGKVFVKGPMVMGFTTSYRMGQLLRYKLEIPEHPEGVEVYEYLCGAFIDAVRECLKDGGYTTVTHNVEQGGVFLLGYRGRLFKVEADFQVGERRDGFDACGCGEDHALGALHVAKGSPRRRIETALAAAQRFSIGVGGPVEYVVGGAS